MKRQRFISSFRTSVPQFHYAAKRCVPGRKKEEFHIYAVRTIDEGIEILTGEKAGTRKADGTYPKGTINALLDAKLKEFVVGLKTFGNEDKKKKKEKTTRTKKKE